MCESQQTVENPEERWEYHTTYLPVSWEACMHVKKQQLELDMEQRTGSQLRKEDVKAVYRHPTYLTYNTEYIMQNAGWLSHKLASRFLGEISTTSDIQMTQL